MWPCTTGEGEEKQNTARKSGKGHENEITHILKNSVYLTSEKHTIKPHWCYDSTDLSSSSARLRESANSIVFLPFSHSSLIFQFSTFDFLSDVSPSALFSNEESSPKWASHNKTFKSTPQNPLKLSSLTDICRFSFSSWREPGAISVKSRLGPKRAWRSDVPAQRCTPPTITRH